MGGDDGKSTASVASCSVNLTKNLIGAGIFSLPTALLRGSLFPGVCCMLFTGVVQGSSFVLIAFLCQQLNCSSYRGVFSAAFGKRAGDVVDVCIMTNSLFACVAYNILITDFLQKAMEGLFGWVDVPRPLVIWTLTLTITLPLSHARDLSVLRYTSMLGLAIIGFVFLYITSDFLGNLPTAKENLHKHAMRVDIGLFTTLALCTGAFQAHYNSPKFFKELGCDLQAHIRCVITSFGAAFCIYSLFAISGLGLFGDSLLGNVLKNYPVEGNYAVLMAWLGMAFAIVFTYPLVFTTGRESLIGLSPALQRASRSSPTLMHVATTSGPVAVIALVSCMVEDVSLITGLLGATIGACLCWIFPASVYLAVTAPPSGLQDASAPLLGRGPPLPASRVEGNPALRAYARGMVFVGFSSMAVGVSKTLGLF